VLRLPRRQLVARWRARRPSGRRRLPLRPLLVQLGGDCAHQQTVDAVKRGPAPEPQRVTVTRRRPAEITRITGRSGLSHQHREPQRVKPPVADLERITLCPPRNGRVIAVRGEQPPHGGNGDHRLRAGRRRQLLAVDRLFQPADADHAVGVQQQHRQYDPLPAAAHLNQR
jgi:hypothetical protein